MAPGNETAVLARKDWTFKDVSALYRDVFPENRPCMNRSVLWADVGTQGRDSIISFLRRRGFFAHAVDSSLDALRFIRERRPDCCILDIALAPVSGLEILEVLNHDGGYPEMAVFIVSDSAGGTGEYEKRLTQFFRGVKVLKKPLTTPEIMQELNTLYPAPAVLEEPVAVPDAPAFDEPLR